MLKIKDNVDLKILKKYGFKLETEKSYYYIKDNDIELFIWLTKGELYKPRYIYYELRYHQMIIQDFSILYNLIKDNLVEKVI